MLDVDHGKIFPETGEVVDQRTFSRLGMLIDPDKQDDSVAYFRTRSFLSQGGDNQAILIGGSGEIAPPVFQAAVDAVTAALDQTDAQTPIIIFPGHPLQIPDQETRADGTKRIAGVLNYKYIMGAADSRPFEEVYPLKARQYVAHTLFSREIKSVSTLYILCGDPNATVSRVTGIQPIDTHDADEQRRVLEVVHSYVQNGIQCIFFDAGSQAQSSPSLDLIRGARNIINWQRFHTQVPTPTVLFVGGGISSPETAKPYAGLVEVASLGTIFEKGPVDVSKLIQALES